MPSGRTTGTVTVNGSEIDIISHKSETWYDRQWGMGLPSIGNWTWLALNFQGTDMKASLWVIDNANPFQHSQFLTLRTADGEQRVIPVTLTPNFEFVYTSNASGVTYPLEWELRFVLADSAYEGFITFSGSIFGNHVDGFGAVEMVNLKGSSI